MGRLHIFEVAKATGTYGETVHQYQVSYNDAGNTYSGLMEEEKLENFLRTKLGLSPEEVGRIMAELHASRNITLEEVDLPENEAGALGLVQEPSDA